MTFCAVNPATGEPGTQHDALDAAGREQLLARVHREQQQWRHEAPLTRERFTAALGAALTTHREALAAALAREMGKPISAARAEVDKCVQLCAEAPTMSRNALASVPLAFDVIPNGTARTEVRYHALGTVLAIMPWNFPYWQALRFAVPALLAGNGVLIKPAGIVPESGRLLQQCLSDANAELAAHTLPPAPCHVAWLAVEAIDDIIADRRIAGVTLTGSDRAGRHVAAVAGRHLKKVVLELGGSDPFLVLPDADVAAAAATAATARTVNAGQSCIAAKRFIVCDSVFDEFLTLFTAAMRALRVGDPFSTDTQVGPLATAAGRDALHAQVIASVHAGARLMLGGAPQPGLGNFYPPTVLVEVPDHAPAAREELFGPVAAVFRVSDSEEAITVANRSPFGLGASVWTQNVLDAERCIAALDVGMITVNDMVVSDARFPFGGVKDSGMGRELGPHGFREFTNPQTVRWVHRPAAPR